MLYLPLATSMFIKSLSVISESTVNCCSFNTFWKFFLSIVLLWILLPPQLEAHNCALDTPWQVQGLRKTLQGWLDTQEKGNITGETGEITFRFHKNLVFRYTLVLGRRQVARRIFLFRRGVQQMSWLFFFKHRHKNNNSEPIICLTG